MAMKDARWAEAFERRAANVWTDEETRRVVGDKDLPVMPGPGAPLLRVLGLLESDATMPPARVRKFLQLNHMLWLLGPPLRELQERHGQLTVVDAGCGLSYLTLALAWCFEHVWSHPAAIIGVDRREDLAVRSSERADGLGLGGTVTFVSSRLDEFQPPDPLHVVIALHACDTATDDAIALGLRAEAELVAVAPCCQAELSRGWSELGDQGAFAPIWGTPHLRRETAATLTDTFRMLLLRAAGYEARVVEFVPSEHTPKNTLIRAVRRGGVDDAAVHQYLALRDSTGGVGIKLESMMPEPLRTLLDPEVATP